MSKPLVSIITVVYNGANTLEQTIKSVIKQSYDNIEYIIIDGGSTDGTLEIIEKYEKHISFWVSERDKGLYDAMNKGIKLAQGDLIGMINSDDWFEKNAVGTVVNAFKMNPDKKVFHGDRFDISPNGNKRMHKYNSSKYRFLYTTMTYNHPSMFIHKEVYKIFLYNTNLKSFSDYELILKLFLKDKSIFFYIPSAYVNYRLEGVSAQQSFLEKLKEGGIARLNAGLKYRHVFIYGNLRIIRFILLKIFGVKHI